MPPNPSPSRPLEGWTYLYNSPKWHYFRSGKSLCGRFMLLGKPELEAHSGDIAGKDDCKGCYRKLEKERTADAPR